MKKLKKLDGGHFVLRNKLRAFEYQLEDNGGLLGTSLALEVRITRNHLNSNNKVFIYMSIYGLTYLPTYLPTYTYQSTYLPT